MFGGGAQSLAVKPALIICRSFSMDCLVYDWKRRASICPRTSLIVLDSSVSLTEKAFSNWELRLGTTSDRRDCKLLSVSSIRMF